MTKRKHSPMHDYWHPRIEGAINAVILAHPNWFRFRNAEEQRTCVNSLAKRLVGTIVGSDRETAMRRGARQSRQHRRHEKPPDNSAAAPVQ